MKPMSIGMTGRENAPTSQIAGDASKLAAIMPSPASVASNHAPEVATECDRVKDTTLGWVTVCVVAERKP